MAIENVLTTTGKTKLVTVLPDWRVILTLSSNNLSLPPIHFITTFTENPAVMRSLLLEKISETVTAFCNLQEKKGKKM